MRVLIIPSWYPFGGDGLMGIYHKEYAESLNKYGIDADVLFINRYGFSKLLEYVFTKKKRVIEEDNFKTYVYKTFDNKRKSFDENLNNYVKCLDESLRDYLKTNPKPDVLHAMVTVPAGYAACVVGKKYNIPVVVTEHGGALERFFNRSDLSKYGKYVLESSTYSTVSNYMKDIVLKYTKECYLIPNQVNTDIFKNHIKRKLDKTFKLVSVCALREGKKLDIAFKAVKKLVEKGIDIHYDIVGDGYYENEFKKSCHDEGLDKYVTFLGRLTKPEIAELFKSEHALLISSDLESFGIPGIEAMASGMPVVSTDCLGPTEYIDKKSGIICKVNDSDDMAKSIEKMIKNYDNYDKDYLEKCASKFSEKSVVEIAKEVYKNVIKRY